MSDEDLQCRFARLREQESLAAPRFERSWAAAARRQWRAAPGWSWGARLAMAGSVAVVVLAAFWMERREPVPPAASAWQAQLAVIERELDFLELSDWQAPSDFLLTANQ